MNDFVINKSVILPGEQKIVRLNIARLHSGTKIDIQIHVYRSTKPGPKILVLGGVHGDEINGVEIVRKSIETGLFENIKRGSIIAIPIVNIYGFLNFSRDLPDGKDVNRSFPGTKKGSLASRVAYAISKKVLPAVDFGIDFHTGGASRYNYPQIRYTKGDIKSVDLARTFAPPFIIPSKPVGGSLRKEAGLMDIPILVFEGGQSLRLDPFSINEGIHGLERIMHSVGMINEAPKREQAVIFNSKKWIRANRSGMFQWIRQSGDSVELGEILGVINDPYGQWNVEVLATCKGKLFGHNNAPVVNQGDALFHIGFDEEILDLI